MRRQITFALFAAVSALTVAGSIRPAPAAEMQDNYCLQGRQSGYPGNCEFSTYQQCAATASGTGEACGINPMRAFPQRQRYQGRF